MRRFIRRIVEDGVPEQTDDHLHDQLSIIPSSRSPAGSPRAVLDVSPVVLQLSPTAGIVESSTPPNQFPIPPTTGFTDTSEQAHDEVIDAAQQAPTSPVEIQLRYLLRLVEGFVARPTQHAANPTPVVNALRELSNLVVHADQNHARLWDILMEASFMALFVRTLTCVSSFSTFSSTTPINAPVSPLAPSPSVASAKKNTALEQSLERAVQKAMQKGLESALQQAVAKMNSNSNTVPPNGSVPNPTLNHTSLSQPNLRYHQLGPASPHTQPALLQSVSSPIYSRDYSKDAAVDNNNRFTAKNVRHNLTSSQLSSPTSNTGSTTQVHRSAWLRLNEQVQAQVLQSLSIIIQSVGERKSLLYIFSNNHINDVLSFDYTFHNEEMLSHFISLIKSIALKLDRDLLQLFFDPSKEKNQFPLYNTVIKYYNYPEPMIRIAVRNVTLTLCSLGDQNIIQYVAKDSHKYLYNTVNLLKKLCIKLCKLFHNYFDSNDRSRSSAAANLNNGSLSNDKTISSRRDSNKKNVSSNMNSNKNTNTTNRKRQLKEDADNINDVLIEIEDLCMYIDDLVKLSSAKLQPLIGKLLIDLIFNPLFLPVAAYACPDSVAKARASYTASLVSVRRGVSAGVTTAPTANDAASRVLLLVYLLSVCQSCDGASCKIIESCIVKVLHLRESRFDDRHIIHALKAVLVDRYAGERLTFFSLLALKAVVDIVDQDVLQILGLSLSHPNESSSEEEDEEVHIRQNYSEVNDDGQDVENELDTRMSLTLQTQHTPQNNNVLQQSRSNFSPTATMHSTPKRTVSSKDGLLMSLNEYHFGSASSPRHGLPPAALSAHPPSSPMRPGSSPRLPPPSPLDKSLSSPAAARPTSRFLRLVSSSAVGRRLVGSVSYSEHLTSPNGGDPFASDSSLGSPRNPLKTDAQIADEERQRMQRGDTGIDELLTALLLPTTTTKVREVRSRRLVQLVCSVVRSVGVVDGDDVPARFKLFLDRMAHSLLAFVADPYTTIVNIEHGFDHLVAALAHSDYEGSSQLHDTLPPADATLRFIATTAPDRRRRKAGPVIDREDADCIVQLIAAYESVHTGPAVVSLMDLVKVIVEECSVNDSYLDKRDAIENVAIAIERHGKQEL